MEIHDAIDLLHDAVRAGGVWGDLGAGTGTFTRALAETLGAGSTIYAVDDEARAVNALQELAAASSDARIVPVQADFTLPLEPSAFGSAPLDGILFANSLHFVRDAANVLSRLANLVRRDGRVIVVEYDRREASQWVPHPIPAAQWPALAGGAGLVDAEITARRPSTYSGTLYVGAARKP